MATKKHPSSVCNACFLNMLKSAAYTVHCVVVRRARSGMSRTWRVWVQRADQEESFMRDIRITGCGWDTSFTACEEYLREFTSQPVNVSGWGTPAPTDLKVKRVIHTAWC